MTDTRKNRTLGRTLGEIIFAAKDLPPEARDEVIRAEINTAVEYAMAKGITTDEIDPTLVNIAEDIWQKVCVYAIHKNISNNHKK